MLKLITTIAAVASVAFAAAGVAVHKAPLQWKTQEIEGGKGYVAPGLSSKETVMITVGEVVKLDGETRDWFEDSTCAPAGYDVISRSQLTIEKMKDGRELMSQVTVVQDASGNKWIWVSRAIRSGNRAALVTLIANSPKLIDRYGREFKDVVVSVRL